MLIRAIVVRLRLDRDPDPPAVVPVSWGWAATFLIMSHKQLHHVRNVQSSCSRTTLDERKPWDHSVWNLAALERCVRSMLLADHNWFAPQARRSSLARNARGLREHWWRTHLHSSTILAVPGRFPRQCTLPPLFAGSYIRMSLRISSLKSAGVARLAPWLRFDLESIVLVHGKIMDGLSNAVRDH